MLAGMLRPQFGRVSVGKHHEGACEQRQQGKTLTGEDCGRGRKWEGDRQSGFFFESSCL